jgi:hypothetical protein
VLASIQDGVGGLLTNHIGATTNQGVYCAHATTTYAVATGISLSHPGPPSLAGFPVHVAAIALDPTTNVFLASQPEILTLQ